MNAYFVYGADNGFETFATAAEAEAVAEDIISQYREDAYEDGWDEDVGSVCWGQISQQAKIVLLGQAPDRVSGSYACDYVLANKLQQENQQ